MACSSRVQVSHSGSRGNDIVRYGQVLQIRRTDGVRTHGRGQPFPTVCTGVSGCKQSLSSPAAAGRHVPHLGLGTRPAPVTGADMRPEISVVLSTYNRGPLLESALRSVLAQQLAAPAFELIVVDNNSTDGTRAIVDRVAAEDGRVRYVFEARQG